MKIKEIKEIKEITLTGEIEHNEVRIKASEGEIDIYYREGIKRSWNGLTSNAERDAIYGTAQAIQIHLDGYKQTNSTVNEYFELLVQLLGL